MKKNYPTITTRNDIPYDILVKIFMALDILDLVTGVSRVCSLWRAASCDAVLWRKIDLSMVRPDSVDIPARPDDLFEDESSNKLMLILKNALNLRPPISIWNSISIEALEKAVMCWKDLESLTVPCVYAPCSMMRATGAFFKNFCELKIMCPFDIDFAHSIVSQSPLKVLSLRCAVVFKEALLYLLENLKHLEVLNLTHCLLVSDTQEAGFLEVYREIDEEISENVSHLKQLLTCKKISCSMCKIAVDQEDFLRWYDYDEGNWRVDEIPSLTV
ncbi:LRR domain containing protein [Parasponia andersonii]|uniref:LRR domain containing protein n=1 Tax=Parasponia andersonii TaxID=3476 RepID=A0A2P5CP61_PARAD|nr:LRR domain containing protein [Parasponia andersonii]